MEFVDTQGIGKTTLNNAFYKAVRHNWFFRSDLGQTGPTTNISAELEELHRDLYFKKIKRLRKNRPDIWKSITIPRQMSRVISESITIMHNDFSRGFLLDESLFKNFAREVLQQANDVTHRLWHKRAFVHLSTRDFDFVVPRYQSRVAERAHRGMMQIPPTDAQVRAWVEDDIIGFSPL